MSAQGNALGLCTESLGALASETVGLDLLGNETVNRTWVDRAARKVTQVTDVPDSTLDAAQTSINGLVLTNATAGGVVATYAYDDLGRPIEARTDSDGGARSVKQTTQYNALGQVAWVEDAANNRTAFAYDAAGRQTAVTNALGQVTTTLYDALGNVTNVTGATYPVSYGYDDWNRMVWMKTYRDENGAGDLTRWEYDLATGLVTNKVYADGKGTAYAYTADGKLSRRTWARGIATDYGYTTAGELETVDYSDATPDVTYTHDRLGRPVTITDVLGTRTNVYDVATLALAQEKLPAGLTLTRSQDVLGRSAGISMPDYAVTYGYDAYGRFGSVTSSVSSVSSVVNYSYLPGSDLLTGYTAGNLTRTVAYEANRDLVDTVENKYGATTVSKFDYTNDALGRRINREDTGTAFTAAWTNAFGYNLRSEVTSAAMRNGNSSYTFDPIGNRTTVTLPEEPNPIAYTANPLNQYTGVTGRTNPGYDDDGNMTDDGAGLGMAWDGENRLIQTVKNGQTVAYAYDYMSRRVSKTVGGTTHAYVYDGWNLLSETDGATAKRYVWGLDLAEQLGAGVPRHSAPGATAGGVGGLLAAITTDNNDLSAIALATADANGNISEYIVPSTGALASHQEYDAFGRVIQSTGTAPSAFGFSTKYTDTETGLVYYGYRYYSPELGKWLSRDPLGEQGGINIYAFCGNASLGQVDALGLVAIDEREYDDDLLPALRETIVEDGIWVPQANRVIRLLNGLNSGGNRLFEWVDRKAIAPYREAAGAALESVDNLCVDILRVDSATLYQTGLQVGPVPPVRLAASVPYGLSRLGAFLQSGRRAATTVSGPMGNVMRSLNPTPLRSAKAGSIQIGPTRSAAKSETVIVRHYTDTATRGLINESGNLRAGSYVTLPSEIPPRAGHLQIEDILEINPGRGSTYIDVPTPASNLRIPANGPTTSGSAWQRQLIEPTPVDPNLWRRPPGRPAGGG